MFIGMPSVFHRFNSWSVLIYIILTFYVVNIDNEFVNFWPTQISVQNTWIVHKASSLRLASSGWMTRAVMLRNNHFVHVGKPRTIAVEIFPIDIYHQSRRIFLNIWRNNWGNSYGILGQYLVHVNIPNYEHFVTVKIVLFDLSRIQLLKLNASYSYFPYIYIN